MSNNLYAIIDTAETGSSSADSGAHDDADIVHAIEEALADDSSQFFDVSGDGRNDGARSPLGEEEREQMRQELKKTEDEIATLRSVLTARLKQANELKRKLGITPWVEVQQDLSQSLKTVKESQAFHRTEEALHNASDSITKKLGQIRTSNAFKSFEEKMGSAYNNVKTYVTGAPPGGAQNNKHEKVNLTFIDVDEDQAKIAASTSIDQLSGQARQGGPSAPGTQPTTPSTEKANSP